MTITADELARVRYWIPESWTPSDLFDDTAVTAAWDRDADATATTDVHAAARQSWGNVYKVAYALTERMRAELVGQADSFSVGGEYSESRGAALNLLLNQLNELKAQRDYYQSLSIGTGSVRVYSYCRPNFYGR